MFKSVFGNLNSSRANLRLFGGICTSRRYRPRRLAANLDGAGPVESNAPLSGWFVGAAARPGEALLRIGLAAIRAGPNISPDPDEPPGAECHAPHLDVLTVALTKDAIARCSPVHLHRFLLSPNCSLLLLCLLRSLALNPLPTYDP